MAKSMTTALTVTIIYLFTSRVASTTFTITNKCDQTIWPGILSNAGVPSFPTTGFTLQKGQSKIFTAPSSWGGRFWARTLCTTSTESKLTCVTGDCGSGKLECSGNGATPPATLAEFTLSGAGGLDFFDVSLVDGYNVPMLVEPKNGKASQNCTTTGCVADLNGSCPKELKVMSSSSQEGVACKSACEAFQSPEYCCSGAYGSPNTCKPSSYSRIFKSACPRAYSYAYDDMTSTFTCASADYTITFCPERSTSKKSASPIPTTQSPTSSEDQQQLEGSSSSRDEQPVTDSTMVYQEYAAAIEKPITPPVKVNYTQLLINGQFTESASGKKFPTLDPRTGDVIAHDSEGDADDINRAVAAARKAFDEGPWPKITAYARSARICSLRSVSLPIGSSFPSLKKNSCRLQVCCAMVL